MPLYICSGQYHAAAGGFPYCVRAHGFKRAKICMLDYLLLMAQEPVFMPKQQLLMEQETVDGLAEPL